MNPLLVVGIMALAVAVAVGLLYLVRRSIPQAGSCSTWDVRRPSTAWCVRVRGRVAFVVFVGFQSFNQGRSGAKLEAFSVVELFRTAGCFGRVDPFRPDPGAG